METRFVVELLMSYWSRQDVDGMVGLMADDVVYLVQGAAGEEGAVAPEADVVRGRDAVRETFRAMLADWEVLEFAVTRSTASGAKAEADVAYKSRHRGSSDIVEGECRFRFEVRDGLVVRIDDEPVRD